VRKRRKARFRGIGRNADAFEVQMTFRRKTVSAAVLLAFALCVAGAAGLFEDDCCRPACDTCPVIYCKTAPATSSPKVAFAAGVTPATLTPAIVASRAALGRSLSQIPTFLSHEFRRPMRN
jgi:hypothetical protein